MDYESEEELVARALKEAQALRGTPLPLGRMVGNRYVPAFGDTALAFMDRHKGDVMEREALANQRRLSAEQDAEINRVMTSMGTPGTKRGPVLRQSMALQPKPDGTLQQVETEGDVPLSPVEENQRQMGLASQLYMLPRARGLATAQIQQGLAFPEKMAQLQQKREDRLAELTLRLEDKALDRASREAMAKESNELKKLLGLGQQQTALALGEMRRMAALAGKGEPGDGKPLSSTEVKALNTSTEAADTYGALSKEFKDDYAGFGAVGDVARKLASSLGSWAPTDIQAANNWWSQYEMLAELPTRNAMFGSALTAPERALWNQARLIKPGSDPKQVREMVIKMEKAAKDKAQKLGKAFVAGGKSAKAVEALTGAAAEAPTPPPAAPGGGRKRYNPATGRLE